MTKFVSRTTAPSNTNKYYLKAGKAGYNRAMEINKTTHSCLPNCCGYVHGRWLESRGLTDYNKYDKLCTGDAKSYFSQKDGYKRGQIPKLGAIACYSKTGASGHVAFVEKMTRDNKENITSIGLGNSAYKGSRFYMRNIKPPYIYAKGYTLQGFIYNPEDFEIHVTPVVKKDETVNQLKVNVNELRIRYSHNTNSQIIGIAVKDGIYNYFEVYDDSKYKWFKIAESQWIANNGSYLTIYPKKEEDLKLMEELKKQVDAAVAEIKLLKIEVETLNTDKKELQENLAKEKNNFKFSYTALKDGKHSLNLKKGEIVLIR